MKMVTKTRAQDEDPKGKGVDTGEMEPPWIARFREEFDRKLSRLQEANDQRFSRLEAMAADFLCRSRKGKEENPEDQICNDEELVETEVATKLNGIEDRAVENEANTKMISAKVKEESIPQSKVSIPQSNSEILKSIEPGKVDLGLEKLEHVVMNEVDGDVERGQEAMSNTKICSAHQLFDQMTSKGKRSKSPKSWKFKFKSENLRKMEMKSALDNREAVVGVVERIQLSHGISNRLHRQDLQDLQQFITFGEVTFQIEHKWKFKGKGREVREELSHTSRETIQEGPSHCFLFVAAAYLTIPMQFGSVGNHVWHRWKARYSQNFDRVWDPGVSSF